MMHTHAKWRQCTTANGGIERSRATSATQTAPKQSRISMSTTRKRPTVVQDQPWTSNRRLASVSVDADVASSRWKELRQPVRTKATLKTTENDHGQAMIADLCPVDRDKVSKLVRRIAEIETLHEESEKEFQRRKEILEAEVEELRQHVRHDVEEIQELSDELCTTRRKVKVFKERVVVLEESTDSEMRTRLEAEKTLDLLRLEVEKLRALVQRQQAEVQRETRARNEHFNTELLRVKEELKQAQDMLLVERNERLHDKQKALDQRLERSAAAEKEKLDRLHSLLVQQQYELQVKAKDQQDEWQRKVERQQKLLDAETSQLKQELNVTQELLQQERENRKLEKDRTIAGTCKNSELIAASSTSPASPVQQDLVNESSNQFSHLAADMQGDLTLFEEVKDLYAQDLFASRRWQAATRFDGTPWQGSNDSPALSRGDSSVSALEISVQEAIEKDMQLLLRFNSIF